MTSPTITPDTVLRRSPDAIEGDLPEETVLLHVTKGEALRINSTAAWLWAQIAEPVAVGKLAERLAERFSIGAGRAEEDVRAFAADLCVRGFLELG